MSKLQSISIVALVLILSGCASSHVLVGVEREPIDSEDVKIYLQPPLQYETVALLEASDLGANGFSAQSRMNKVIGRLKDEAADLGANGVLLQDIDTQVVGAIGTGFANTSVSGNSAFTTGTGYSAAQVSKVGKAIAIYVPPQGESDQRTSSTLPSDAVLQSAQISPRMPVPDEPLPRQSDAGPEQNIKTLYKCPQADGTSIYSSVAKEGCVVMGNYSDNN